MAWKPDYATTAALKSFVRIDDNVDDAELGLAITAASRAVDTHAHRQFGKVDAAEERVYEATWDRRRRVWVVVIDDVMVSLESVTNEQDDEIDDYTLYPRNAEQKGKPWELLVVKRGSAVIPTGVDRLVKVTAVWGWSAVPDAVKQATLLQASRFHARRFSPYGIAGSADTGSELRLMQKVDPDVGVSLRDYVRWWAAA